MTVRIRIVQEKLVYCSSRNVWRKKACLSRQPHCVFMFVFDIFQRERAICWLLFPLSYASRCFLTNLLYNYIQQANTWIIIDNMQTIIIDKLQTTRHLCDRRSQIRDACHEIVSSSSSLCAHILCQCESWHWTSGIQIERPLHRRRRLWISQGLPNQKLVCRDIYKGGIQSKKWAPCIQSNQGVEPGLHKALYATASKCDVTKEENMFNQVNRIK